MEQNNGCTAHPGSVLLQVRSSQEPTGQHSEKCPSGPGDNGRVQVACPQLGCTPQEACSPSPWGHPSPKQYSHSTLQGQGQCRCCKLPADHASPPPCSPQTQAIPSPQHPPPASPASLLHACRGDVSLPCPCGRSSRRSRRSGEWRTGQSCLQAACREEEKTGRLAASQQIRLQQQSLCTAESCSTKASLESA